MTYTPSPPRPGTLGGRSTSRLLGLVGLAALVAASLASSPVQAGQVINATTASNGGLVVSAKYKVGSNTLIDTGNILAGSFTTTFNSVQNDDYGTPGSIHTTYCVDLSTYLINPPQAVNAWAEATSASGVLDSSGVGRDLGAAGWVYNTYANLGLAGLQAEFSQLSFNQVEAEAAIQMAIWKAAYDSSGQAGDSSNTNYFGQGNLQISGSGAENTRARKLANAILATRQGQISLVGFLNYPQNGNMTSGAQNQDQLFGLPPDFGAHPVPEPSTLAMAAVGGLLGLGMLGRKRLMTQKHRA